MPRLTSWYWRWGLAGAGLVGLHFFLLWLSPQFAYERDIASYPIITLVGVEVAAGVLYLLAVWEIARVPQSKGLLIWMFIVGALLRVAFLASTPMLEDDYYRYLWDGGVTASGQNPYTYAPEQCLAESAASGGAPPSLIALARQSGAVIARVNHPHLRTIYPPVSQAAFALAHWICPWSLRSWRVVLLGFDVVTLGLLIVAMQWLRLPLLWLAVYWWNPVLVKEIFNSGHMDLVALPFVLGALLLARRRRSLWATGCLGVAMGAKIWPLVLGPVIWRPLVRDWRRLIPAVSLLVFLGGLMLAPMYGAGLDRHSGFLVYGQHWEMNDALFMLVLWGMGALAKLMGYAASYGGLGARIVVATALVVWIGWLLRRNHRTSVDLWERSLLIVAAVFLLSPAQFPWYYVWIIPFLTIRPRRSLLLLTALLPLYYLRFHFSLHGRVEIFDYGIVWLEYVPVWYLLIREWRTGRRTPNAMGVG
ncbi:MAG: DUF2029 domain-containing protein [Acidobacteria bacterium]|nr:MAG: DUF2029 domain-containing protein [Acidobacteriota bacterium]